MKKLLFLTLLACLGITVLTGGCAAFRRTFSRTPDSMRRTPPPAKKQKAVHKRGSSDDKLFDTVFRRDKDKPKHITSTALSEQEKALVEGGFNELPRSLNDDPDIRRIREQDKKSRQSRRDEVFGTHDGRYF